MSDAVVDERAVSIRGRTVLLAESGGWRLGETRLLDVRQKQAVAAQLPELQEPQPALPAGTERRQRGAGRRPTVHQQERGRA